MEPVSYYKTRLRARGQITLPPEVREQLGIGEGDDVVFYVTERGQVRVDRVQIIPPDQAWFWSERWQEMERQADQDILAGKASIHSTAEEAIRALHEYTDADDRP